MKKHRWLYAEADSFKVGNMVCEICCEKIITGDFRYREANDCVVHQHRKCTNKLKRWIAIDDVRRYRIKMLKERLNDYENFRDRWGEDALDDEIVSIQIAIDNTEKILN